MVDACQMMLDSQRLISDGWLKLVQEQKTTLKKRNCAADGYMRLNNQLTLGLGDYDIVPLEAGLLKTNSDI